MARWLECRDSIPPIYANHWDGKLTVLVDLFNAIFSDCVLESAARRRAT